MKKKFAIWLDRSGSTNYTAIRALMSATLTDAMNDPDCLGVVFGPQGLGTNIDAGVEMTRKQFPDADRIVVVTDEAADGKKQVEITRVTLSAPPA